MGSIYLLARELMPDYQTYNPFVLLFGLIYGILPVFPVYGLAFTSIPFVVFLVHKIYSWKNLHYYILLFPYMRMEDEPYYNTLTSLLNGTIADT